MPHLLTRTNNIFTSSSSAFLQMKRVWLYIDILFTFETLPKPTNFDMRVQVFLLYLIRAELANNFTLRTRKLLVALHIFSNMTRTMGTNLINLPFRNVLQSHCFDIIKVRFNCLPPWSLLWKGRVRYCWSLRDFFSWLGIYLSPSISEHLKSAIRVSDRVDCLGDWLSQVNEIPLGDHDILIDFD